MAGAQTGYPPPQPGYYQQPMYAPPPAQPSYPPPYPPQQQPPQQQSMQPNPNEDYADFLIRQHKQLEKAAKAIARRADRHAPQQEADHDASAPPPRSYADWEAGLQYMSDDQLDAEMAKHAVGSRHHRALVAEIEAREAGDEFGGEDAGEIEAMQVRNVYVDDGSTGWIQVNPSMSVENLQDLADQVRASHPYARKMKYGQVVKDGRVIKNHRGSSIVPIRSDDEVRANIQRDVRDGKTDPQRLQTLPPPPAPPGLSSEGQVMFKALAESQTAMVASILQKPKEDGTAKMLEMAQFMKTMVIDPVMTMMTAQISAMNKGGGDNKMGLELAQAVITGATSLAKVQNNGGGAGGAIDSVMGAVERFAPMFMKPQAQPALPAPATEKLPEQDPAVNAQRKIREKIGNALQYLLKGRLTVRQLPKYAYQNLDDGAINHVLGMAANGFAQLVGSVATEQQLPQTYMQRPDVRAGFVWVYEEIQRMALVLNWHEQSGRPQERPRMIAWATPEIVPWREQNPIIGEEAANLFAQQYPQLVAAAAGDELPPMDPVSMHEAAPSQGAGNGHLHIVTDEETDNLHAPNIVDGPEPTIVDPFGGGTVHRAPPAAGQQRRAPLPVQRTRPSTPDFGG